MSNIENFIIQFSEAANLFQYGMCYWFAFILKERYGGEIYYHPIHNHFATRIGGVLYDSLGELRSDGFEPWEEYKKQDELETARIVKNCIKKDYN